MSGIMAGRKGLVMGVANKNSIAWGIARALHDEGAELILTYQAEMLERRVTPLAEELGAETMICDAMKEADLAALMQRLEEKWGGIDFIVHAVAFADKSALEGRYIDTTEDAFTGALAVSAYSFTALCRHAEPLFNEGASALTLSYYGAEKVIPHYNVMGVAKAALEASTRYLAVDLGAKGVRVNAISAGPIKTLAAAGIAGLRSMLKWNEINAPLKRNIDQEEVGKSALYLLSDMASGVTGEVHYVDAGYNAVGMLSLDEIDKTADFAAAEAERRGKRKG